MSNMPDIAGTTTKAKDRTTLSDRSFIAGSSGPNPLASVVAWELRRIAASRSTWLLAGLAFLFFVLIVLLLKDSLVLVYGEPQIANGIIARPDTVRVSGISAWGMAITMPKYLLLVLGMLLPFIAVDGVARDFRRRAHEILMATRVPTWAYVVGRYIAVLVV